MTEQTQKLPENVQLDVNGKKTTYGFLPAVGSQLDCFYDLTWGDNQRNNTRYRPAQGEENAAYLEFCLRTMAEWIEGKALRFPSIVTTFPVTPKKNFGRLEGALIISPDLDGRAMQDTDPTYTRPDTTGFVLSEGGIYTEGDKKLVPQDRWYTEDFPQKSDENNGALIALCGVRGAEALVKTLKEAGKTFYVLNNDPAHLPIPLQSYGGTISMSGDWNRISAPKNSLPSLFIEGEKACLNVRGDGRRSGYAARVLREKNQS